MDDWRPGDAAAHDLHGDRIPKDHWSHTGDYDGAGYPAAVATPVGADPTVVGPYLASVLNDQRWRSVDVDLIAAGMSNLTYVVTPVGGSDGRRSTTAR